MNKKKERFWKGIGIMIVLVLSYMCGYGAFSLAEWYFTKDSTVEASIEPIAEITVTCTPTATSTPTPTNTPTPTPTVTPTPTPDPRKDLIYAD